MNDLDITGYVYIHAIDQRTGKKQLLRRFPNQIFSWGRKELAKLVIPTGFLTEDGKNIAHCQLGKGGTGYGYGFDTVELNDGISETYGGIEQLSNVGGASINTSGFRVNFNYEFNGDNSLYNYLHTLGDPDINEIGMLIDYPNRETAPMDGRMFCGKDFNVSTYPFQVQKFVTYVIGYEIRFDRFPSSISSSLSISSDSSESDSVSSYSSDSSFSSGSVSSISVSSVSVSSTSVSSDSSESSESSESSLSSISSISVSSVSTSSTSISSESFSRSSTSSSSFSSSVSVSSESISSISVSSESISSLSISSESFSSESLSSTSSESSFSSLSSESLSSDSSFSLSSESSLSSNSSESSSSGSSLSSDSSESSLSLSSTSSESSDSSMVAWFLPNEVAVNVGSVGGGTLRDVDINDNNFYTIDETTGIPGFSFDYRFLDVENPAHDYRLTLWGYYEGNPAHNVKLRIWNFSLSQWDDVTGDTTDFPDGASKQLYNIDLPSFGSTYWENDEVQLRVIHTSSGAVGHYFHTDFMRLSISSSVSSDSSESSLSI